MASEGSSSAVAVSRTVAQFNIRDALCHYIRSFTPMDPQGNPMPMELRPPRPQRYNESKTAFTPSRVSWTIARQLLDFNAACFAPAAQALLQDDTQTHRAMATIVNVPSFPVIASFVLVNMNSEAGWQRHCCFEIWLADTTLFYRMEVQQVDQDSNTRRLRVTVLPLPWSDRSLRPYTVGHTESKRTSTSFPI
ncbi:hypothetical protein Q1695_015548 [Nippostrongylus brasiliensis]|nr:hypothetical protein Q1695_015548 [Nippostrongylus brasiliensis]